MADANIWFANLYVCMQHYTNVTKIEHFYLNNIQERIINMKIYKH